MNERINLGSNQTAGEADCTACTAGTDALLARLPELAIAWSKARRRVLQPGETLIRAGQEVREAWFVESGLLRLYYLSPEGLERNRSFHAEGKWLGVGPPPIQTASPYVIEALECSTVVEVPYETLDTWRSAYPGIDSALQEVLLKVFLRQSQREAELLTLDATARYQAFLDHYGTTGTRIPLHHVASYLGITNVALSRIRRSMKAALPRSV